MFKARCDQLIARLKRLSVKRSVSALLALLFIVSFSFASVHFQFFAAANDITNNPYGAIDTCSLNGTTTQIIGWADDPNAVAGADPSVTITLTKPDGSKLIQTVPTNVVGYRDSAINSSIVAKHVDEPLHSSYGFEADFSGLNPSLTYHINGFAINVGPGNNNQLFVHDRSPVDNDSTKPIFANNQVPASCLPTSNVPNSSTIDNLIPDTNLAPPAGAIYTSPTGSDAANGGATAPVQTLAKALSLTPAGGTVVMRAGVYREGMATGSIFKRVTIQPYPHEKVWLDGSQILTNWQAATPGVWYVDNWQPPLCSVNCVVGSDSIDPAYPAAGSPQMLFVDNTYVPEEVTSLAALKPNSFFYDQTAHRLYLGSDPTGHTVSAAYYPRALQFISPAAGSVVQGIGIRFYGSNQSYASNPAMVIANASNLTFDHDAFYRSAATGLVLATNVTNTTVSNSVFEQNGFNGILSNYDVNTRLIANHFSFNNAEHFAIEPTCTASCAAAGVKLSSATNAVVSDNVFDDNTGKGFWCDVNCSGVTFVRNRSYNNYVGVHFEISTNGIFADNLIYNNTAYGFEASGSNSINLYNNTLSQNGINLAVLDDLRDPLSASFALQNPTVSARARLLGLTWDAGNITAVNNLLDRGGSGQPSYFVPAEIVTNSGQTNASQFFALFSHNSFYRPTTASPTTLIVWCNLPMGQACTNYSGLSSFQTATSKDDGGQDVIQSSDPYSSGMGDIVSYKQPSSDTQVSNVGLPLPANIAQALGLPASQAVSIGVINYANLPSNMGAQPVINIIINHEYCNRVHIADLYDLIRLL